MSAKPSLSEGENIQFLRYYHIWMSTVISIQRVRNILRDLVICLDVEEVGKLSLMLYAIWIQVMNINRTTEIIFEL